MQADEDGRRGLRVDGIVERLRKRALNEFYRAAFRKRAGCRRPTAVKAVLSGSGLAFPKAREPLGGRPRRPAGIRMRRTGNDAETASNADCPRKSK